jgi:RNA-binding protein YhbY
MKQTKKVVWNKNFKKQTKKKTSTTHTIRQIIEKCTISTIVQIIGNLFLMFKKTIENNIIAVWNIRKNNSYLTV